MIETSAIEAPTPGGDSEASEVSRTRRWELITLGLFFLGLLAGLGIGFIVWNSSGNADSSAGNADGGVILSAPQPDQPVVDLVARGVELQNQGDPTGAEAAYLEALELDPNFVAARYNLGVLSHEAGDLPGAIEQYKLAIKIDPGYSAARFNWAVAARDLGDTDEAIDQLEAILSQDPDDSNVLFNLALILNDRGEIERATELILRAQEIEPGLPGLP
jgi:tetratricopeptide (TPR) repeat protein